MRWAVLAVLPGLCSCVSGATIFAQYAQTCPKLPAEAARPICVEVSDNRPEVASGEVGPAWGGVARTMYGIPSKQSHPFGTPQAKAIRGYVENGVRAAGGTISPDASTRLVLDVRTWKFDIGTFSYSFYYDLRASLYEGERLVSEAEDDGVLTGRMRWSEAIIVQPLPSYEDALSRIIGHDRMMQGWRSLHPKDDAVGP